MQKLKRGTRVVIVKDTNGELEDVIGSIGYLVYNNYKDSYDYCVELIEDLAEWYVTADDIEAAPTATAAVRKKKGKDVRELEEKLKEAIKEAKIAGITVSDTITINMSYESKVTEY
jgi:hypothetical protein